MATAVTTCIVVCQWGATATLPQSKGVAFQWSGKVRTLWFNNHKFPRRPPFVKVTTDRSRTWGRNCGYRQVDNTSELSERSVRIRKPIDHNIPGLVVYATWSMDGSMKAFHIEKASGLPFTEGQVVLTNVRD